MNSYKKTMHRVRIEIFSIKFLTRLTTLNPTTKVASGNKTEIKFVKNQFHCHWILKMIHQNKLFNPPVYISPLYSILETTLWRQLYESKFVHTSVSLLSACSTITVRDDWFFTLLYNELSQKNRFQSVPIVALCLYNIQRENLVFKNSLCITTKKYQVF